jgi:hypothetical protein
MLKEKDIHFLLNTIDISLNNSDIYAHENTLNFIYNYLKDKLKNDKIVLDNELDYMVQLRDEYNKNKNNKNITYQDLYFS